MTIRSPGLFESIPLTAAAFYIVFGRDVGGLAGAIAPDEFAFHLTGFEADEDTSSLDFVGIARTIIGRDVELEVLRVAPYFIHELIADTYRSDRVFVAGDAAHLFCPYGGYNMNTGIGDAADVGWKLAGALAGWGGDALLDSYTVERRQIALQRCAEATFNVMTLVAALRDEGLDRGAVSISNSPAAASERKELGQRLFERTVREWITEGVVLDQRYTGSPVVVDDGSVAPTHDPMRYQPFAKPGHRAPHAWLDDGVPIYDRLGRGFTLVALGAPAHEIQQIAGAAADRRVPLEVLRLDDPRLLQLYGAPLVLVRPDQQVAWRGNAAPADSSALIDVVRGASRVPARSPLDGAP